jgi:CheY-like chemotaxis protein
LGVAREEDSPLALRRILMDAIESLKPNVNVPSRAKAWRTYQVLYSRYVEQFTQKETAVELGLSVRHLRREESSALQALATYLWHHYDLESKWRERTGVPVGPEKAGARTPSAEQELGWLQESVPSEPVDVQSLISEVLQLARSLAQASQVHIECRMPDDAPHLIVQRTTLRQALLAILTATIRSVPGGRVTIQAQVEGSQMRICIQLQGQRAISGLSTDEIERLETARRLVDLSSGSLELVPGEGGQHPPAVEITLPAAEQIPVLVIDDNVDTLQLLQRYLSNSRYRFIGTSDPEQAMQLARESSPQMIVLDVMLPDMDGWELLGRLRQHPQALHIPIIVCTILPQEHLALSLGAAGFVRKPVTRKAFLSALDCQLALLSRESP